MRERTAHDEASSLSGDATPTHRHVAAETVTEWLEIGSRSFSDRFRQTFSLEEKGFEATDVAAAKAALSNMLGGMGHFSGRSEVRGAGRNGGNGFSFEASLFTGVPSRSFFPRGFLWDEGFHQVRMSTFLGMADAVRFILTASLCCYIANFGESDSAYGHIL